MKTQDVKRILGCSTVSRKGDVFTARKGFFYRSGQDAASFVKKVTDAFENVEVVDYGEIYKPFRGGAPVSQQSHWFVKFRLEAE